MNTDVMKVRVAAPLEELAVLEGTLRDAKGVLSAADVARALAAAGSLLRRLSSAREALPRVEALLRLLPSEAVAAFCASVDLAAHQARLRRATDEAVEAALPEQGGEEDTWRAWAQEGADARERLEAQLVALRFREALGPGFEQDRPARERLSAALELQDAQLRGRARWLVALNPWRRAERDLLDPEHRPTAWWFTARAECDDLLLVLSGEREISPHVRGCAQCQRDLEAVKAATRPRVRHLSSDDLWNYDLGLASPGERAYVLRHARTCGACAQALAALEDGEDEIRALTSTGMPAGGATVVDIRAHMRPTVEPEVLAENADFRLLVFRRQERVKVLLQPQRQGQVAAAALHLKSEPSRTIPARPGPQGWEFELGDASRLYGAARVRVRMQGAGEDVEQDVEI